MFDSARAFLGTPDGNQSSANYPAQLLAWLELLKASTFNVALFILAVGIRMQ